MLRIPLLIAALCLSAAPTIVMGRSLPVRVPNNLEQMERVSIQDEGGSGSPVILIPGLSSSRHVWDAVVPALLAKHHVYTVQVNGFGSDDPVANLRPGILAGSVAELDAYIQARSLKGAAIVGHSMGGLLGMMLENAHPSDVGRLMIVDSLPYIGDLYKPGVTVAQVEPQAAAMRDRIASSFGKPRDTTTTDALADSLAATQGARGIVKSLMAESDPRVVAQAMYEDMTTDMRPSVAGFTLPITVIYPKDGNDLYHAVYAQAAKVTYVPVADAGHFVMLDQPEAFEAALDAFLE